MTTAMKEKDHKTQAADVQDATTRLDISARKARVDTDTVWGELSKGSFLIIGYVTPSGQARSSGVLYKAVDHRLYVVVASDSWKARHIALNDNVAVTVPVRRGGLLSLVFPIPPATITFHGKAVIHAGDSQVAESMAEQLRNLLPAERREACSVIEIEPEGSFVTYGIGVTLNGMRDTKAARARIPVT